MFDEQKVNAQLAQFGEKLIGDTFLFNVVNLDLPRKEQFPAVMTGEQTKGMIRNGHYHVEFLGENRTSKAKLREKRVKETRDNNPEFQAPKSLTEELAEAKAEAERLKAELAKKGDKAEKEKAEAKAEAEKAENKNASGGKSK